MLRGSASSTSMEKAKGKEWTSTEKSREEDQQASNQPNSIALPGTSAKRTKEKMSIKGSKVLCPKKKAEHTDNPRPQKKIPIPPLPSKLPPVNLIHRDILRAWCQQLKLSSKGQKLDAYKRLCAFAYPNQKVVCGPWEKSPCRHRWLGSPAVSCWSSLGSRKARRESECTLLASCLQFSTPAP
ncbi:developmental pluripotency-associated protein 4 isoform 3 [Homo sapiens]|uniref:developmental pluripotency-associated protein 4 isoform 3 n=1 Tax=Homo sapiens TaxID=9606 RepID=UPI0001B7950C|nr:developmental pluripotency-associated protein 4 isoform 3 [Homo sapiens]|eukprot:NP_001335858.1 developmental pluripotency-associated protein 4 isoform 3 [Homo sapiens]